MTQLDHAKTFKALHQSGNPLVLYNVWDAGSAKAIVGAGATAIATGSKGVAEAQGYADGQHIPLDWVMGIARQIVQSVDLPVTVDFEGAYGVTPDEIGPNITRLIKTGAIGLNFEDQIIGDADGGIYDITTQQARIKAIRAAANASGIPLFINARTDMFLKQPDATKHTAMLPDAIARASAFKDAGADCFFVPFLADDALIKELCAAVDLPVNIMKKPGVSPISTLAQLGVQRISYGPFPYAATMAGFAAAYTAEIKDA